VLEDDDDEEDEEPLVVDLAGEEDDDKEGDLKDETGDKAGLEDVEEPLEPRAGLDAVVHDVLIPIEPLMEAVKLEDGRNLLEWFKSAEEARAVELWSDGRLGPTSIPLDVVKTYYSVKGFQSIVGLVTEQLEKPVSDMATGLEGYFGPRAALTSVPSHKFLDFFNVSTSFSRLFT